MTLAVTVDRLRLHAAIGVMEQERLVGNDFEVTATLRCPLGEDAAAAIASADDIALTVSYADVVADIRAVMSRRLRLLETAALLIAGRLRDRAPQCAGGCVTVTKLTPPIAGARMAGASVTVEF